VAIGPTASLTGGVMPNVELHGGRDLREITLSVADPEDGQTYEPPTCVLSLAVIGDRVHLDLTRQLPDEPPVRECSFRLSARSLLLALRAAWDDAAGAGAWCDPAVADEAIEGATSSVPAQRRPRPPQAGRRWSADNDAYLRDAWLAAAETTPAGDLLARLADDMERTRNGVRSRLVRLQLDPDIPGRALGAGSTLLADGQGE